MGYNVEFQGYFETDRPVDEETYQLFTKIANNKIITTPAANVRQPQDSCHWMMQEDHQTIEWDGVMSFNDYLVWLNFIILWILHRRGYTLNGTVAWRGDDFDDMGRIHVTNNIVTTEIVTLL